MSGFVETRRAVLRCLSSFPVGGGNDNAQLLLGSRIDLWTDLFKPLFLQHLEVSLLIAEYNQQLSVGIFVSLACNVYKAKLTFLL